MSPTGIDESWAFADPAKLRAAGVQVVSMYLSHDPSKNMTAAKVKAYHAAGIGVLFNWEAVAGAPLSGGPQGSADATSAVQQARDIIAAVGTKPRNRPNIYHSCDTDVNSAQFPIIDEYYKAARQVEAPAGFGTGVYGEASLVIHLAHAGITDGEWQTVAWSGGVLSPDADFYQSSINNTIAGSSVDFDRLIHPAELGAWWPPGSQYDVNAKPPTYSQGATDMRVLKVGSRYYVWQSDGKVVPAVHADYANLTAQIWGCKIAAVSQAFLDRIITHAHQRGL